MSNLKLDFKQKIDQRLLLKLSPQQIQFIQLLQLPTLALEQRIKEEMEINPALEDNSLDDEGIIDADNINEERDINSEDKEVDEADLQKATDEEKEWNIDDYIDEEDREDYAYKVKDNNYPSQDDNYEKPLVSGESFHEHLMSQLRFLILSEKEYKIGETIVGNIDDNGYLQRGIDAMANDLAFFSSVEVITEQVEKVLEKIQSFDPPGVGAKDLRETLLIQLKLLKNGEHNIEANVEESTINTALQIIEKYFDEFIKRRYEYISDRLHIDNDTLQEALEVISTLNPKPGSAWTNNGDKNSSTIIPDYYLTYTDEGILLSLNSKNDPYLKISPTYNKMLESYKSDKTNKANKEAASFVKEKIDSARWFMEMIKQRQNTLLTIGNALIEFQKEYMLSGDIEQIRPMRLKDISAITHYDISTISRVTAQKYIQTPFGIIPLKALFSQGIQDDNGIEISTSHIKEALKALVDQEDKTQPLSDEAIVDELKKQNLNVARRTVAKYRQIMGIPVGRLRRTLQN